MNFKIISHTYENTGGGCMVAFDQIWLPDEDRTIFATTNETGVCLYTADRYHGELDDLEPFEYLDITYLKDVETLVYYDMFRTLLCKYATDAWNIDHETTFLPFVLLTDDLQQAIDPDYKYWNEHENGSDFETDGTGIIVSDYYIPKSSFPTMPEETYFRLVSAMRTFRDVYFDICKLWNGTTEHIFDETLEDYPFDVSFDELNIAPWVEAVLIEAAKDKYKE